MSSPVARTLARPGLTFAAASLAVFIAFGASALPVPLMSTWTREFGLSTAAIGMTVFLYVVGNALALLFFARLSEAIGRRGAVFASLAFSLAACGFFLAADSPAFLMAGRLLQGLACGITTTAAMSWCVDSAPAGRSWLAAAVSSSGPLAGFVVATIGAGVAIEMQAAGTRGLFFTVLLLELLVALLVFMADETITKRTSRKRLLKPAVMPPPGYGKRLALAATGFVGTSALTCFFQGFSARVAEGLWGNDAPIALLAGVVYISLVLPNALGAFAAAKLTPLKFSRPWACFTCLRGAEHSSRLPGAFRSSSSSLRSSAAPPRVRSPRLRSRCSSKGRASWNAPVCSRRSTSSATWEPAYRTSSSWLSAETRASAPLPTGSCSGSRSRSRRFFIFSEK